MADRIRQLERYVAELVRRVEDAERRVANVLRPGRVAEVDAKRGLVKVAYAKDESGTDVVGPWIRWAERAGGIKTWMPPGVGEQVLMVSPSGDISGQSWALPGGFSRANPQPHDQDGEYRLATVGASILVAGDKIMLTADDIVLVGNVHLGGEGGELVHRKGDKDSDGDTAVGAATKVYAV